MQILKATHYMFGRPAQPIAEGQACRLLAERRDQDPDLNVGRVKRIVFEDPRLMVFETSDGFIYIVRKELPELAT